MNILEFFAHPDITGDTFTGESWAPWRAVLAAAFGLPLTPEQEATFKTLSGGMGAPTSRVNELWVIAGRRSAKTQTAGAIAVYLATVGAALDHIEEKLSLGERGVIALIATSRQQAKVALGYIRGLVEASPALNAMVERSSTEGIDFDNRISIEVHANSYRAIRGRTLLAVLLDEVAFFHSDNSANPDTEIYRAAIPGLATTGGMLIGFSSPYAKRGLLYQKYLKHYGRPSDVLVVQGATADFNPTISQSLIAQAMEDDPEAAMAEWGGQFRNDVDSFISRDVINGLVRISPLELPYTSLNKYRAFVDPAGGGADEFTLSIAHVEQGVTVVDLVRAQRGTPALIVEEYAAILRAYRIRRVHGDRYAGSWPADEFRKHGITYLASRLNKSELYKDALPLLNSGRVELPPCDRLINQITQLERRTSRSGRDSIDHPPGGHDDRANAVCGALSACSARNDPVTNIKVSFVM